jgi:hypothetical protein
LIALQMPEATMVCGFRAWLKLGYCVRRGETALRIWIPMGPSRTEMERWQAGAPWRPTSRARGFGWARCSTRYLVICSVG